MESITEYLKDNKKYVDEKLKHYLKNGDVLLKDLHESINYTLYSDGKRIRPLFSFIVGDIFEVPREQLASSACAVEMIHTASLIMDDLPHMDNAKLRRGKPANHLIYGQDVASLASIALIAKANEIVLNDSQLDNNKKTQIVDKLAHVLGINGLVGGQYVDLKYSNTSMDDAILYYIHTHKTVALFAAAGEIAAIIGEASTAEMKAITHYAHNIGFAFQILDDLLDVTGNSEEVGKPIHNDNGSYTLLHGVDESRNAIQRHTEKAFHAIKSFNGKNEKLIMLGQMLLNRKS